MSRYNTNKEVANKIENLAGGQAYKLSDKNELITFLFSSFMKNDRYYKKSDDEQLIELVKKIDDKQFLAKAAIYARNQLGMRSVTHALIGELVKPYNNVKGQEWVKKAVEKAVRRPDDITEILSYLLKDTTYIPHALKKGLAKSFDKFDGYQLAKYKAADKKVSLIDAVRLLNVKPVETNEKALHDLVKGELKEFDTWETEISKAGSDIEKKSDAWKKLLLENKLGYMALLKNVVNLITYVPDQIDLICEKLTDRDAIKKSLVLPFRFYTAYCVVENLDMDGSIQRKALQAISTALDISLDNVKPLEGKTLIALDESGSMYKVEDKALIFAAVLAKTNNADLMTFSSDASYRSYSLASSTIDIVESIESSWGGTNFTSIFKRANTKYDNIIIISDMQGWGDYYYTLSEAFKDYREKYNANPKIYSFDLQGYGDSQFKENDVFLLSGWSEKVFDLMELLTKDRNALIKMIDSIQI